MGARMETLEAVLHAPALSNGLIYPAWRPAPAAPEEIGRRPVGKRRKEERWSGSLSARDLRCLLSMLEESVIPNLIAGYSPALVAPIEFEDRVP